MQKPKLIIQNSQFSYPVFMGEQLFNQPDLWQELSTKNQVFIISDENVAAHYLAPLLSSFGDKPISSFVLKAGENSKTLAQFEKIMDALIELNMARDCLIIGLGGGMVTDMAGFVAACYMRGVAYISIPTTLLAQVDAAIGGKTALNHLKAKNIMGCFYQPKAVIIDVDTLNTLPDREFRSGLAEVIKMAVTLDSAFFMYLESHIHQLLARNKTELLYTIQRCCELKAKLVQADEKDEGVRSLLNFGHSYGHALEKLGGYHTYLHGEAVAIGMVIAAEISVKELDLNPSEKERLINLIRVAGLPSDMPNTISQDELTESLRLDKKVKDGKLRLVLLRAIGNAQVN